MWNYLSMALRGGGIFLPLSLAVFCPRRVAPRWGLASMVLSTAAAVVFSLWPLSSIQPLFVGLLVSAGVLMVGALRQRGAVPSERTEERNPTP